MNNIHQDPFTNQKTSIHYFRILNWIRDKHPELTKKLFPHSTLSYLEKKKLKNLFIDYKKYKLGIKIKELIKKTDDINQIQLKEIKNNNHTKTLDPQKSIHNNLYMDQLNNTESILISNFIRYIQKEESILFSTETVLFNRLIVKEFDDYMETKDTKYIEQEYNLYVEIIRKLWIKYKNEFTVESEYESPPAPQAIINFKPQQNKNSTLEKTSYITIPNPFQWFFTRYPEIQDTQIMENQENCQSTPPSHNNSDLEQVNVVHHQPSMKENPGLGNMNTTTNLFSWFIQPYLPAQKRPKQKTKSLIPPIT